jgi:chitin synthase
LLGFSSSVVDFFGCRIWASWEHNVYDLTDYVNTLTVNANNAAQSSFLSQDVSNVFQQQPGQDITKPLNAVFDKMDANTRQQNIDCLNHAFFVGGTDFRKTARCQVQNFVLLVVSGILVASITMKCKFITPLA